MVSFFHLFGERSFFFILAINGKSYVLNYIYNFVSYIKLIINKH